MLASPERPAYPAAMETLAFGYGLVEAPRVDGAGNLYFSDAIDGGVFRRAPDGAISVVVPRRRGVGGLALHADGGVVVSGRDVSHVRAGETRVLLTVEGVLGFNDLTTDAAGRVFVGSLRSSALEREDRVPGELWRIDGAGRATEVYRDVAFANGVCFSPDGRTIYHSNYSEGVVLAHDLAADGVASNRRVFARVPPIARSPRGRRPRQLESREEEADLRTRRRRRVRPVGRVLLHVGAELAADRALGGLLRVRGAHEIAPAGDRAVAFEDADEHR